MNNFLEMGNGSGWIIGLVVLVVIIGLIASIMKNKSNRQKFNSPHDILKYNRPRVKSARTSMTKKEDIFHNQVYDHLKR